jgi:hypothetical protein
VPHDCGVVNTSIGGGLEDGGGGEGGEMPAVGDTPPALGEEPEGGAVEPDTSKKLTRIMIPGSKRRAQPIYSL